MVAPASGWGAMGPPEAEVKRQTPGNVSGGDSSVRSQTRVNGSLQFACAEFGTRIRDARELKMESASAVASKRSEDRRSQEEPAATRPIAAKNGSNRLGCLGSEG